MKLDLAIAVAAGALVAPALVPDTSDFDPQELPAKAFSETPVGAYGDGLIKAGAILGGAALASSRPEAGGAIVASVGIVKLAQIAMADSEIQSTEQTIHTGIGVALLAVGIGMAFGGAKTLHGAQLAAASLGTLGLVSASLFIFRQNQANEKQLA